MNKKEQALLTKLIITTSIMSSLIIVSGFALFYYYSYKTFADNFEDYLIDEHTSQEYLDKGIKNEWILGVTAHSIDLVQAVHGDAVANHLLEKAEIQVEDSKLYREKIDGKYIYYRINVDLKNGEKIYKYSTIKDIYLEQIPKILEILLILLPLILGATYLVLKNITNHLTSSIHQTSQYLKRLANYDLNVEIDREKIFNKDVSQLIDSFEYMQSKLKEQHELRESILQYISHEMKTPIMIINSYTESAKEGMYPKDRDESFYDLILRQTERMSKKINELLLVVNLDSNIISENKKIMNLNEIFYNVYDNFSGLNSHIKKSVHIHDSLYCEVYPQNVEVLFENLLINSLKYAHSSISITGDIKENNLVFCFTNDGEKITQKVLENIFKPFVKGENGSTGLGLAICKQITMMHGGNIMCISNDDYTTITVNFPLSDFIT